MSGFLSKQGVQVIVNINKINFESYDDLIDYNFPQFNEALNNNEDPPSQRKNNETLQYFNKNVS